MIDTHTHIYLPEFAEDQVNVITRALESGVKHFILPNVGLDTVQPMKSLASAHPSIMSMAMGLHPTEVNANWQQDAKVLMDELKTGNYVAVGEIGIDLYWDKTFALEQMQVFDLQLKEAAQHNLPVIIHCRDGLDQTLEVLQDNPGVKAVFHSFGGNKEDVEKIRRVGDYYFGINGIVTFKNCKVREVLPEIGLERLLIETDAPYLSPVPHRGKRNEPSYLPHTAAHIAQTLSLPLSFIDEATTANASKLFNLAPV